MSIKKLINNRENNVSVKILLIIIDAFIIFITGALALWMRFDFDINAIPADFVSLWIKTVPLEIVITIAMFLYFDLYSFVWRAVGILDLAKVIQFSSLSCIVSLIIELVLKWRLPISYWVMHYFCEIGLIAVVRAWVRIWNEIIGSRVGGNVQKRIMIVGGGVTAKRLIQDIYAGNKSGNTKICCCIDDSPVKLGNYVEGVKIIGDRNSIIKYAQDYNITDIVLCIPSASEEDKKAIVDICMKTSCRVQRVQGTLSSTNSTVKTQSLKVEDLLGRETVKLDNGNLDEMITGKTILVTGGGGSIGSELCRQIAEYNPKLLIVLDIYENNAYDLQQELRRKYGNTLNLKVEIASVRDKEKIYELFGKYAPDLVIHAAAHKHVPLMEDCPKEAVKNNIFGTYHVVRACEKSGVKKCILISTDKAVNPTNFMGATKRFCEMIMQSRTDSETVFCAVRFGNVLGSNGSVVPLFEKQIADGGPITITDKRIIRYFMTIPEASRLVLLAGSMADRGQIFVLDMGEPVRILDLAENMVKLHGLIPYEDIEIKEVGLRPGEKLYEELLMASNDLVETENKRIFVEQQQNISREEMILMLEKLDGAVSADMRDDNLVRLMMEFVPTYKPKRALDNQK